MNTPDGYHIVTNGRTRFAIAEAGWKGIERKHDDEAHADAVLHSIGIWPPPALPKGWRYAADGRVFLTARQGDMMSSTVVSIIRYPRGAWSVKTGCFDHAADAPVEVVRAIVFIIDNAKQDRHHVPALGPSHIFSELSEGQEDW